MPERAERRRGRIPFEPALDGLRGLALIGMLCFHAEFPWAVGGFLPIATFFTLSGYLITSLFLVEAEAAGRIRVGAFWARRFRRLMPASLLTLGAISLFGAFVATPDQLARLRGDVFWALAYLANWRFLLSDIAYAQLFEAPSPVQHFWSLGIEEQFYFVFPLIAAAGLWLGSGSRAVLGAVFGSLVLGSVFASVGLTLAGASADRIYYGTDTRGAEIMLGALLALVLCGRTISSRARRRVVEITGAVALLAMVGLWTAVDLNSNWLYVGGFAAYSLLSAAVIAAGVQPSGLVRMLLSGRALRWVGRVSYGAYLFHWPIYLWLSSERTGLEQWPLFALRILVVFGLAGISYEFFEAPIRTGRALRGWRPFVATPAALAVVAAAAIAVTGGFGGGGDLDGASDPLAGRSAAPAVVARVENPVPSGSQAPPRVAVYGDSTAFRMSMGLGIWSRGQAGWSMSTGVAELGCGLMRKGVIIHRGRLLGRPRNCLDRESSWSESVERGRPDVAIVFFGPWEVADRRLPGQAAWLAPGDPIFDAYLRQEMLEVVDILSARGALVVWLTHPVLKARYRTTGAQQKTPFPETDPARMARFNELIFELEELRPGSVRVVDLASYMRTLPGGELDADYRPDGVHLTNETSAKIAADWLGGEILRVYSERPSE